MPVSERKLSANRANSLKSTGPKTDQGKLASSQNAVVYGLFCRNLVLPCENEEEFKELRQAILSDIAPHGALEEMLTERIVAINWKMRRIQRIEWEVNHVKSAHPYKSHYPDSPYEDSIGGQKCHKGLYDELLTLEERLEQALHRNLRELDRVRKSKKTCREGFIPTSQPTATHAHGGDERPTALAPEPTHTNPNNEPTAVEEPNAQGTNDQQMPNSQCQNPEPRTPNPESTPEPPTLDTESSPEPSFQNLENEATVETVYADRQMTEVDEYNMDTVETFIRQREAQIQMLGPGASSRAKGLFLAGK